VRGQDVTWLRDHPARLAAVEPEQVHAAAAALWHPGRLDWTVLGDADRLHAPLATVTEVTPLDGA